MNKGWSSSLGVGKVAYNTSSQQTNILQNAAQGLGTLTGALGWCEMIMNLQVPLKVGKLSTSLVSEKQIIYHDEEYEDRTLFHHHRCDRSTLTLSTAQLTLLSKPQTWQCCSEGPQWASYHSLWPPVNSTETLRVGSASHQCGDYRQRWCCPWPFPLLNQIQMSLHAI